MGQILAQPKVLVCNKNIGLIKKARRYGIRVRKGRLENLKIFAVETEKMSVLDIQKPRNLTGNIDYPNNASLPELEDKLPLLVRLHNTKQLIFIGLSLRIATFQH